MNRRPGNFLSGLVAGIALFGSVCASADESATAASRNPHLGQKEALDEGEKIYRSRCFGCHFRAGGRGPNIFRTKLSEQQFFDTVKNGGRSGMPAWGSALSDEEIWKVHAFVMSRDHL